MQGTEGRAVVGLAALLGVFVGFAVVPDFSGRAWLFYSGWFVAWVGLVLFYLGFSGGRTQRKDECGAEGRPVVSGRSEDACRASGVWVWVAGGSRQILLVALALRLLALVLPLTLSDDVFRYVWDGQVIRAGMDPYALAPDAAELEFLRDDIWLQTAHRDVPTVYPPAAQGLFAVAAGFPKPVLAWRAFLLVMDLLACALLGRMLAGMQLDSRNAVLYAWNPLVVIEGVGMGHVDVAGTCLLVIALYGAWRAWGGWRGGVGRAPGSNGGPRFERGWSVVAGCALASGVLFKLVPLILVPLWWMRFRSWGWLLSFSATLLVGLLPIILGVGVPPGLLRYGVSWEFNGALFEPLWRLLQSTEMVAAVKSILGRLADSGWPVEGLFHYVYPQFLAKMILAGVLSLGVLLLAWKGRGLTVAPLGPPAETPSVTSAQSQKWLRWNLHTLMLAMVCTATLYPWYLIWVLPIAAAVRSWPVLLLSVSVAFSYLPQLRGIDYFPWVWALVWLPPATLVGVGLLSAGLGRQGRLQE